MELWNALDVIAERIRALGHPVPGSLDEFARLTSISKDEGTSDAIGMVRRLVEGHEAVIVTARDVLQRAEAGGDAVTADLATQRIDVHEKTAWMLRSTSA